MTEVTKKMGALLAPRVDGDLSYERMRDGHHTGPHGVTIYGPFTQGKHLRVEIAALDKVRHACAYPVFLRHVTNGTLAELVASFLEEREDGKRRQRDRSPEVLAVYQCAFCDGSFRRRSASLTTDVYNTCCSKACAAQLVNARSRAEKERLETWLFDHAMFNQPREVSIDALLNDEMGTLQCPKCNEFKPICDFIIKRESCRRVRERGLAKYAEATNCAACRKKPRRRSAGDA